MRELSHSQHTLYTQALKDPSQLSEEDLLQLIVRYPYSQPLIFAYERRKVQCEEGSPNKSLALLYAQSAAWLYAFVNQIVVDDSEVLVEDVSSEQFENISSESDLYDDTAPTSVNHLEGVDEVAIVESFDDSVLLSGDLQEQLDTVDIVQELVQEEALDDDILINNESLMEEASSLDKEDQREQDELDLLVNQGSVMVDYLVFESKKDKIEQEELAINDVQDADNVSLYNDDLMPYSFRWWLQKTRLEHASTYQPFIVSAGQKSNSFNTVIDFNKIDEHILDQQIKENFFHFQDPEEKLSEQVRSRPLPVTEPKKTDIIIERFIREEPIIQAPSAENLNTENMARQSAEDNYVFVTETLANIYKEQGLFQKSIEVLNKLILKYPEKKSYFASQIQELEKNL